MQGINMSKQYLQQKLIAVILLFSFASSQLHAIVFTSLATWSKSRPHASSAVPAAKLPKFVFHREFSGQVTHEKEERPSVFLLLIEVTCQCSGVSKLFLAWTFSSLFALPHSSSANCLP